MATVPHDKPLRALIWCAVSSKPQAADDKISLEVQERDARAWCVANGYEVVTVLKVPGYSRRESDVITALEDFAEQGIYAYQQLREMWQRHEFDVLVAYAHDRLGRSNTLHSWILENVILSGAQIYLLADGGFVDLDDFRYKLAIGGMMAATPVDRLIKARREGMKARAQRGLPVGSRIPISHSLIRDPQTGRALCLEVDESKRRLWDDLATLILEGVSWHTVEAQMYERFGHVDKSGKPYSTNYLYKLVMRPLFWGHTAQNHNNTKGFNRQKVGRWAYDESAPLPGGVMMYRNTHPAVWTGEQGQQIQAEINRRIDVVRGTARPQRTYRFTGLVMCDECHSALSNYTQVKSNYHGMICKLATSNQYGYTRCSNSKVINEKKLIAYFDAALRQYIESELDPFLEKDTHINTSFTQQMDHLAKDIDRIEGQISTLIREQASATEEVQPYYRSEIDNLTKQLRGLKNACLEMQQKAVGMQRTTATQRATREDLKRLSVDRFWQQDSRTINQMLHALMGKNCLLIRKAEIVGFMERPIRNRRPPVIHS